MATAGRTHPITIEQYLEFAGYPGLRDELIHGQIVMSPQPKVLQQQVAQRLYRLFDQACEGSDFVAGTNTNIRFANANSMPAPDVLVVSKAAWRRAIGTDSYLDEVPVIVIEVISPANRRAKVREKPHLYLTNGVQQVWTIDPKRGEMHTYTSGRTGVITPRSVSDAVIFCRAILAELLQPV